MYNLGRRLSRHPSCCLYRCWDSQRLNAPDQLYHLCCLLLCELAPPGLYYLKLLLEGLGERVRDELH